jgi:hypothetical protein
MTRHALLVFALLLLPISADAQSGVGANTTKTFGVLNGHFWNLFPSREAREAYVAGATDALIREAPDAFKKNYMAGPLSISDAAVLVGNFYGDRQNLDIPIIDAIHIVSMKVNGASAVAINEEISTQRDVAALAPERVSARNPVAQAPQAPTTQTQPRPSSSRQVEPRREIDDVIRSGKYSQLPRADVISPSTGTGPSHLSIKNKTIYALTVTFYSSVEQSVEINAGQSLELDLVPGKYRVLGRTNVPTVLPFVGNDEYSAGTAYESTFYVKSQIVP